MTRSNYSDDIDDNWAHIRWRGAVESSIRGKRGQSLIKDIVTALDAIPEKRLIANSLATEDGEFCTLGAVGQLRGIDISAIDDEDYEAVAKAFGISNALAREIMYLNDEYSADDWKWVEYTICGPVRQGFPDYGKHTRSVRVNDKYAPNKRWKWMKEWALRNIRTDKT